MFHCIDCNDCKLYLHFEEQNGGYLIPGGVSVAYLNCVLFDLFDV